jgi:NO-binding membrane sensor protein with MHYT domain
MNASAVAVTDSSLLLWVLAALVAFMTASICLGWLRQAQLNPTLAQNWKATVIAALVAGTGFTSSVVLALSAESLPFPLGFRLRDAPLLWVGSVIAFWPAFALMGCRMRWPAIIGGATILGLMAVLLPAGWVFAAGFRPGIVWRYEFAAAAVVFSIGVVCIALFVAYSEEGRTGHQRTFARMGAAVLMALAPLGGQQILLSGTNMPAQVGSAFRTEVPSSLLCLVLGVMVPLVWSLLMLDLRLRRQEQRRIQRRVQRNRRHQDSLARESQSLMSRPTQAPKPARDAGTASGLGNPSTSHPG